MLMACQWRQPPIFDIMLNLAIYDNLWVVQGHRVKFFLFLTRHAPKVGTRGSFRRRPESRRALIQKNERLREANFLGSGLRLNDEDEQADRFLTYFRISEHEPGRTPAFETQFP